MAGHASAYCIFTNMHTVTARMNVKRRGGGGQDRDGWPKQTAKRLKCESWKIFQTAFSRP